MRFDSDVFLVADGVLPAEVSEAAQVQSTRFEPEVLVPPRPGDEVRRAVGAERDRALGFDEVARRLPAGLSRDGEPVFIDVDFLDGTKGAHVNISGVSGVATKTSYGHVPALRAVPLGGARRRGRQHEGIGVQRQGGRPALPRPREHRARS